MLLKVLNLSRTKKLQIRLLQKSSQQPLLLSNISIDNDDDDDGPEILDFHCAYSCPKVARKVIDFDDDKPLSDSVTSRLADARAKAIQKYREIYIQA
jgi:hypothetical protein